MNGRLEHDLQREKVIARLLSTMPGFMVEYDENMKASGRTTHTRVGYLRPLGRYFKYVADRCGGKDVTQITPEGMDFPSVQSFFIKQQVIVKQGELKEASDSHKLHFYDALNSMFSYLKKRGYVKENPMELIERPKNHDAERIREKRILLNDRDFKKILAAVDRDVKNRYRLRNKAILLLFMMTGMRKSALSEVNIENIKKNRLGIIDKRKKTHYYYLDEYTQNVIREYMQERRRMFPDSTSSALFLSSTGDRIPTGTVYDVVKRYTYQGIGKSLSPHKLRAGFINILYTKTRDLNFTCKAVGHSAVTTTARYLDAKGKERKRMCRIMSHCLNS